MKFLSKLFKKGGGEAAEEAAAPEPAREGWQTPEDEPAAEPIAEPAAEPIAEPSSVGSPEPLAEPATVGAPEALAEPATIADPQATEVSDPFAPEGPGPTPVALDPFASEEPSPTPQATDPFALEQLSPTPQAADPFASEMQIPAPQAVDPFASEELNPTPQTADPFASEMPSPTLEALEPFASEGPGPAAQPPDTFASEMLSPTPEALDPFAAEMQEPATEQQAFDPTPSSGIEQGDQAPQETVAEAPVDTLETAAWPDLAALRQTLEQNPRDPQAHAGVLQVLAEAQPRLQFYQALVDAHPDVAYHSLSLGRAYRDAQQNAQAIAPLQRYLRSEMDPSAFDELAEVYGAVGDTYMSTSARNIAESLRAKGA